MKSCPRCHAPLPALATTKRCPECDASLPSGKDDATVDQTVTAAEIAATVDNEAPDLEERSLDPVTPESDGDDPDRTVAQQTAATLDASEDQPPTSASATSERSPVSKTPAAGDSDDPTWVPEATVDEASEAPPAGPATIDAATDATLDHVPTPTRQRGTVDGDQDVTLDAAAAAPSPESGSSGKSGTFGQSEAGNTGHGSRIAKVWGNLSGDSGDLMSSLGTDEQIASETLFQKLRPRSLSEPNASPGVDADYQLLKKLGEGAMGVVFSAQQKAMDRTVAIKAIKPAQQDSEDSKRKFLYEAQITGDLDHPNIVPIHELGSNRDGTLFYSMKLVSGTPWKEVIQDKSRAQNIDILLKVADAMGFAHSKGIIHRDLKPENVMLGQFGEVLVMDWGLAISLLRRRSFGLGGTPAFMAPEMARHDPRSIGKGSDIYLLGAILFQIVVGRAPHTGKNVRDCLMSAAKNLFVPHDEHDPLVRIAKRAMATRIEDRFETVADFQNAIREYQRHAESIAITNRAATLLQTAIERQDYQTFARVLFSLDEALELWPENEPASIKRDEARLAYGQCAFDKGDHDLCVQTLIPGRPAEDALIAEAHQARAAAATREQRIRRMRRVLTAVILIAVIGLSALSAFLKSTKDELATTNLELADTNNELASTNNELDTANDQLATANTRLTSTNDKLAQTIDELDNKNRQLDDTNQQLDEKNRQLTKSIAAEALARREAERNLMISTLGGYQSQLNLALTESQQYDVARSRQLLDQIRRIRRDVPALFSGATNPLENWAFRRVALLGNEHLRPDHAKAAGSVGFDLAGQRPRVTTIQSDGSLRQFDLEDGRLQSRPLKAPPPLPRVQQVASNATGNRLLVSGVDAAGRVTSGVWTIPTDRFEPLPEIDQRRLQLWKWSPDDDWLVGGINGGLWIWRRDAEGRWAAPQRATLKGRLQALVFAAQDEQPIAYGLISVGQTPPALVRVDLETAAVRVVSLPESLAPQITTMAPLPVRGELIVGTRTGPLYRLQDDDDQTLTAREVLPRKHFSAIKAIDVDKAGNLLTMADEPVAHLWQFAAGDASLKYVLPLLGPTNNLQWARLLPDQANAIAVDQRGKALTWDLSAQQQQRRLLPKLVGGARTERLPAPVRGLFADARRNTWQFVDANGVLITQPLRSPPDSAPRIHTIGHAPNAELLDAAAAPEAGQLVTLARRPGGSPYHRETTATLEMRHWDLRHGQPLRAIDLPAASGERIETLARGRYAVVGGEDQTTLIDLKTGQQHRHDFGADFAVAHPAQPRVVMLVRRSGAVQRMRVDDPAAPTTDHQFRLAAYSEAQPIEAAWSPRGDAFYLLYSNGRLARFPVNEERIGRPDLTEAIEGLAAVQRLHPWQPVDFACAVKGGHDVLAVSVGQRDGQVRTTLSSLAWPSDDPAPQLLQQETLAGRHRLRFTREQTTASVSWKELGIDREASPPILLAPLSSDAWVAVDENGAIQLLGAVPKAWPKNSGRVGCIDASAATTKAGTRWMLLQQNGMLWRVDVVDNESSWERFATSTPRLGSIRLSSQGRFAAALQASSAGARTAHVFEVTTGRRISSWPEVTAMAWHPDQPRLLVAGPSNRLIEVAFDPETQQPGEPRVIPLATEVGDAPVRQVRYFAGTSTDRQVPAADRPTAAARTHPFVALLRDSGVGSQITLHPIDPADASGGENRFAPLRSRARIKRFATSPNEPLLVTGDDGGSLVVWFAAPAIDRGPRELFTLSGHLGTPVRQIRFSRDGTTLFSADTEGRLIGRRSQPVAAER